MRHILSVLRHACNITIYPLVCYATALLDWSNNELHQVDVKSRSFYSIEGDVDYLYLPASCKVQETIFI